MLLRDVIWLLPDGQWPPSRLLLYLFGCVVFSLGVKMFIDSDLGADPLHAMIIGVVRTIELPFVGIGFVASLTTFAFLIVWSMWNRRLPPLSTFVTMALVGYLIDFWNLVRLERFTTSWLAPMPLMLMGLVLDAYASALIIMSGIGLRVMDLMAISFVRKLGWRFLWAKLTIEAGFVAAALLLGGPIGVGTVGFLAIVGTLIPLMMWVNGRFMGLPNHGLGRTEDELRYVEG